MASEIKEPLNNTVIARGNNAVKNDDGNYLISGINPYPNEYLNNNHVGDSFKIKDTNLFPTGVLLELVAPPGGGMQTATFTRPG